MEFLKQKVIKTCVISLVGMLWPHNLTNSFMLRLHKCHI